MKNEHFIKYNNIKLCIKESLYKLHEFSKNENFNEISKSLEAIIEKLKNENFKVVVVGEFSRGKSTFINALLGQDVLPSSVLPTTATINVIKYCENDYVIINYNNNKPSQKISIDGLKKIIAPIAKKKDSIESLNQLKRLEALIKTINNVEIFYPTDYGKDDVEIIDTPGVNDIDQIREEITYGIIPTCDAAILLMDANQILTASEQKFLKEKIIKNDIKKIFFVINKIDEIDENKRSPTVEYAQKVLSSIIDTPKVFPISSILALDGKIEKNIDLIKESNITNFENALSYFLTHEKGKLILTNPYNRALRHLSEMQSSIISQKKLIKLPSEEFDIKKKTLEGIIKNTNLKRKVFDDQISYGFQALNSNLKQYISREINDLCVWLFNQIENVPKEKLDQIANFVVNSIKNFLKNMADFLYDHCTQEIKKLTKQLSIDYAKMLKELSIFSNNELSVQEIHIDEEFGFQIEDFFKDIGTLDNNKNDIEGTQSLIMLGGLFFGPAGIVVAAIGNAFLDAAAEENHTAAIKQKYKAKINTLKAGLTDGIIETINETINSIHQNILRQININYNCGIESVQNSINSIVRLKNNDLLQTQIQHDNYENQLDIINQIKLKLKECECYILND